MAAHPNPAEARAELVRLLEDAGHENNAAFARLYRLTSAKLFGICLRICGERQGAEDVLQEVYATVWKRAGAFEVGRASPITWLAAIARNRAIDWRRAQNARGWEPGEAAGEVADDRAGALDDLLAEEADRRLLFCLDQLDEAPRSAIRQAFLGGLTYAELAERRGVPLGTAKSWIRRGLLRLKGCLDADA